VKHYCKNLVILFNNRDHQSKMICTGSSLIKTTNTLQGKEM